MQLVTVQFGVDKRAGKSYETFYNSKPNRHTQYNYLWDPHRTGGAGRLISKGDYVVVHTPSHGLTVVEVLRVEHYEGDPDAWKYVVDIVAWESYEFATKARMAEAQRRREEAQDRERARQALFTRIEAYEHRINNKMTEAKQMWLVGQLELADPEFKKLREELANLKTEYRERFSGSKYL